MALEYRMCLSREAVACRVLALLVCLCGLGPNSCRLVSNWCQHFAAAQSVHSLNASLAVLGTALKRGSRWGQSYLRPAPRCRPWRVDDLTLSTASTTNPLVPTYSDKNPIIWDGNNAHIAGTLYEVGKFYKRTGLFQLLLKLQALRCRAYADARPIRLPRHHKLRAT